MKKFIALLLAVAMLCALCTAAFASQSQANLYRSMTVGHWGTMTQNGNFRATPDENSYHNGRAYDGQSFLIYGFAKNEKTGNYWYLVDITGMGYYSWVSASVMDVDMNSTGYMDGTGYCIVTGNGIRARSGPGTNYDQRAVVTQGNGFKVYEISYSGSKPWYRISVEGIPCWISSGICNYYPY